MQKKCSWLHLGHQDKKTPQPRVPLGPRVTGTSYKDKDMAVAGATAWNEVPRIQGQMYPWQTDSTFSNLYSITPFWRGYFLTFPSLQWLRLWASTAGSTGSIPGWGTKIPHAKWWPKKKKKNQWCGYFDYLFNRMRMPAQQNWVTCPCYRNFNSFPLNPRGCCCCRCCC